MLIEMGSYEDILTNLILQEQIKMSTHTSSNFVLWNLKFKKWSRVDAILNRYLLKLWQRRRYRLLA
jgi:hypothetical protein